ncbi:sigma factor-like helix-turn-helix DNA-binding protein [Nocardia sp. CA-128927]|uniref:sigma factor-like helix-turn-helix DNA-binding protein n=1 Tax=Nocardia sp. CA-128927 TaxID=3239975 RepID=UPI003D9588D1
MSALPRFTIGDLARRSWLDVLPWLADHRAGPPLLGEGELMPNAWMSTAAGAAVPDEHLDEVCRRLATVFLDNHQDIAFAAAFPYASTDPGELGLSARARTALDSAADSLGQHSATSLAALRGVGPSIVAEIVAALVRHSATVDASTPATVAELDRITATLNDRDRYLLTTRLLAEHPSTLAECGAALGVSRERVNQLDNRLRDRMHTAFQSSLFLRRAADGLTDAAQPVAALARLVAADPDLDVLLPATGTPVWFALARLDTRVDIVDGWVVAQTMEAARGRTRELLARHATDEGLVHVGTLAEALGVPVPEATEWVAYCGYRMLDEHVLARVSSVTDSAAAVLALAGTPLKLEEIQAAIVPPRSVSSVRNALVSDERFVKADRFRWALARWGGARYIPIHRQIGELLDEHPEGIAIEDLVHRLTGTFDVKEHSVRTYAASGEFATVNGIVARREKSYRQRKSPTKTRHLYREGAVLRWRTTLAAPHVKGSAFNLPSALAGLIGAGPGRSLELTSRLGPQSIIWVGVQARSGTIKRFIDDLGLRPGDEVFVEFALDADAQFDVRAATPPADTDPLRVALAATGHGTDPTLDDAAVTAALADALWLPGTASTAEIVETLRARKEDDLADLIAR